MKRNKSIIALLLALIMIFIVTACSSPSSGNEEGNDTEVSNINGEKDSENDPDDTSPASNDDESEKDSGYTLPEYNLTNKTVQILNHHEFPNESLEYIKELYGIEVEHIIVDWAQKQTKFVSMSMAGEAPDLLLLDYMPALITDGYVQPFDDYMDMDSDIWEDVKESNELFKRDGKTYYRVVNVTRNDILWYNKKLFEENGMITPREYYEDGNWTWNTLREAAIDMTFDMNNDGEPDIYGLGFENTEALIYTTGATFINYNNDGTAENNLRDPRIARAMDFLSSLIHTDKVVNPVVQENRDKFIQGQIAMLAGPLWWRSSFKDMIGRGEIDFVPYPRDPEADKYYIGELVTGFFMGKDCKNPEGAAALLCAFKYGQYDEEKQQKSLEQAADESNWTLEMNEWFKSEFMDDKEKHPVMNSYYYFKLYDYWGQIFGRTTNNGEPWSAVVEDLMPLIDDQIKQITKK
jgi:multiple sugar transport system substrate-binding protein